MAKIFTKLNLADIVVSSGGKSFRKLSTEEPITELTDLTGTTWLISPNWNTTSGQGIYYINGTATRDVTKTIDFTGLRLGYSSTGASENSASFLPNNTAFMRTKEYILTFTDGADVTNADLIAWVKQYGVQQ